jgi:hypothetical protein
MTERELTDALNQLGMSIRGAADALGVDWSTLWRQTHGKARGKKPPKVPGPVAAAVTAWLALQDVAYSDHLDEAKVIAEGALPPISRK